MRDLGKIQLLLKSRKKLPIDSMALVPKPQPVNLMGRFPHISFLQCITHI